MYEFVQYLTF